MLNVSYHIIGDFVLLRHNELNIIQRVVFCDHCAPFFAVNVALNKPTDQQFPYKPGDDTYDSSNAVDGLKADLTLNGGQCVYSEPNRTATWWVNLTSIHSIHHITIYFMTGTYPWGIHFKNVFLNFFWVHIITDLFLSLFFFCTNK